MGFISLVFGATGELLITYFCIRYLLDKKWEYSEIVLQQFTDCRKACGLVRRVFFYNILIELLSP
jgi:hypothetical protein